MVGQLSWQLGDFRCPNDSQIDEPMRTTAVTTSFALLHYEALQQPDAFEAGRTAYLVGIKFVIDDVLDAKVAEAAKHKLMLKIGEVSRVKVNVTQEKRKVEKTTVTEHTKDGRIQAFIREQITI